MWAVADVAEEAGGLLVPFLGVDRGDLHGHTRALFEAGVGAAQCAAVWIADNDDINVTWGRAGLSVEALSPGADDEDPRHAGYFGELLGDHLGGPVGATEDLDEGFVEGAVGVGGNEPGVAGSALAEKAGLDKPVDLSEDVGLRHSRDRREAGDGLLTIWT